MAGEIQKTFVSKLVRAYNILSDPKRWVRGHSRKQLANGTYAYCLSGVLNHVGADQKQVAEVLKEKGWGSIPGFNDNKHVPHEAVLAVLGHVIQQNGGKVPGQSSSGGKEIVIDLTGKTPAVQLAT